MFGENNGTCFLILSFWSILKATFFRIIDKISSIFSLIYDCCCFIFNELFDKEDDKPIVKVVKCVRPNHVNKRQNEHINQNNSTTERNDFCHNNNQNDDIYFYDDNKYKNYSNHKKSINLYYKPHFGDHPNSNYNDINTNKAFQMTSNTSSYNLYQNDDQTNSHRSTSFIRKFKNDHHDEYKPSFMHSSYNSQSSLFTKPVKADESNQNYDSQSSLFTKPIKADESDQNFYRPLSNDDKKLQKIGKETMKAVETGRYAKFDRKTNQNQICDIKTKVDWCISHTETIKPQQPLPINESSAFPTFCRIDVTTESSFSALHRIKTKLLIKETCVVNFASATKPGGGFLNGRGAQEETLSRQSALYSSLLSQTEMYEFNKNHENPFSSDYMIYSPNVPFFRDDKYHFIDCFRASVITSPAVNYGQTMKLNHGTSQSLENKVYNVMKNRCERILKLCISRGNRAIVIGAFGCGVFKNPPEMVSRIFRELFYENGYGQFLTYVVFPIYSKNGSDSYIYKVFKSVLQNN